MDRRNQELRIAVLQRVCPEYRIPLFGRLSSKLGSKFILFIGQDVPNSKVKSSADLGDINHKKLETRFLKLGSRIFPWHIGLIAELRKFDPDVVICEGESHFIGYVQAIAYRYRYKISTALIHWCFISLPGWSSVGGNGFRALIKKFFRRFFDAFLVYSSYSKECLIKLGQPSEKIFVATNVGNVERFIDISDLMTESTPEARAKLGLSERFTALYVGTLDEVKRPGVMLDIARLCDSRNFNFVLLGTGPLLAELRQRVVRENLPNVYLPGRVVRDLPLFFRAADVLVVPGRGGIVISEAMAFGLPVIVHQADGIEYDLIQNGETGFILPSGNVDDFRETLEFLSKNPNQCKKMGIMSKQIIKSRFTTANMVDQIIFAARFARNTRNSFGNDLYHG